MDSINYVWIDDIETCSDASKILSNEHMLAINLEGVNLSRHGEICLMQIATIEKICYVFDIQTLGVAAFNNGLEDLLKDEFIEKIFYDIRADCDSIHKHYGIIPVNVIDCQIAVYEALIKNGRFVVGMMEAVGYIGLNLTVLEKIGAVRERAQMSMFPEFHGNYDVIKERPLEKYILEYAIVNVMYIIDIYLLCVEKKRFTNQQIKGRSFKRMMKTINSATYTDGKNMAYVDWKRINKIERNSNYYY